MNPYVIYRESNVIFSRVYMFGRCIITWFMLSLKVFIVFDRIFTYFKISFYWVDIPEFIFWMKLWILWKDTDVSFFIDCSMFLVLSIGDVSMHLCALWKAMQKRWGRLRTWIVIRRRKSILLLFWNSSREPQLRNLLLSLNPFRKKPKQIELRAKVRPKPLRLPQISQPSALPITSKDVPPPPPKRLRSTCLSTWDLRHYVAPESIISSRLDKRSPEFRVARVWYIRKLKEEMVF